jgi:tubulin polyglutamylase TTLL6/13
MVKIKDIIVKTMISGQPHLQNTFRTCQLDDFENSMCFQILGFDIMLDHKCKPYLLEVNHNPSLTADSPLDEKIKGELVRDTINLLGLTKRRRQMYNRNLKAFLDSRILGKKFVRLDPELKEAYRKEFDEVRDEYENEHLGRFEKIYPVPDP